MFVTDLGTQRGFCASESGSCQQGPHNRSHASAWAPIGVGMVAEEEEAPASEEVPRAFEELLWKDLGEIALLWQEMVRPHLSLSETCKDQQEATLPRLQNL